MSDWQSRLRDADPARGWTPGTGDLDRVRHALLAAARERSASAGRAPHRPQLFVAALLVIVGAAVTASWHAGARKTSLPAPGNGSIGRGTDAALAEGNGGGAVERQHLQFATPGGTRIIWVFDSSFELKGTLP